VSHNPLCVQHWLSYKAAVRIAANGGSISFRSMGLCYHGALDAAQRSLA
jgi:hypothetical protein